MMKIKNWIVVLFLIALANSCNSNDSIQEIEGLLEISIPECYTETKNPNMENNNATVVVELVFDSKCFNNFLDDIAEQSPSAYCGTKASRDLTMAFCTSDNSAYMTINTITRTLHFEKLK